MVYKDNQRNACFYRLSFDLGICAQTWWRCCCLCCEKLCELRQRPKLAVVASRITTAKGHFSVEIRGKNNDKIWFEDSIAEFGAVFDVVVAARKVSNVSLYNVSWQLKQRELKVLHTASQTAKTAIYLWSLSSLQYQHWFRLRYSSVCVCVL